MSEQQTQTFEKKHDIAFVFSSYNRLEMTRQSLESIDTCSGFDVIWLDGSKDQDARDFVGSYKPKNMHIAARFYDVGGGPDAVITSGLNFLAAQRYAYCGLIENDIKLEPGWFPALMSLFGRGAQLGMRVGAASVRTYDSRVLAYGPDYALMWNIGAAMIMFHRPAMEIVLANYYHIESAELMRFYHSKFNVNLQDRWELARDIPNWRMTIDFRHSVELYKHNYASLSTVPNMATNLDMDQEQALRTFNVRECKQSPHFDRIVKQLRDGVI